MSLPLVPRKWRVIAYIVGDQEGLTPDQGKEIDLVATQEARKMVRAARGLDDIYLAVQVDLTLTPGGQLFVVPGSKEPIVLEEERAGLNGIAAFVEEAREALPAEHTMVILWGHGGGPLGLFADPNGGRDSTTGAGRLTLPQLRELLRRAGGACDKKKIDVLLVKSCYVATLEAAREIDTLADYVICSQARVPMRTWSIWEEVFEQLCEEPDLVVRTVMKALREHYADVTERNDRAEIPFSLIRPGGVREHVEAPMQKLCAYLTARAGDRDIGTAIEQARPDAGGDKALLDVRTLLTNLINVGDPALTAIAAEIDRALVPGVVVENTAASGAFGGIGVFHFPPNPLFRAESFANEVTRDPYGDLTLSRRTGWDQLAFPALDVTESQAGAGDELAPGFPPSPAV